MSDQPSYRVLARKYRPETFADLVGQEAMVRTLRNAFETDRIAHAFILTGVRGVGKTTTARIIAKGLNCTGPDGKGGPTIEPCGQCDACIAIAEGRHVDVMEMDAASRTGVGDIREIIDSVAYRAVSARYKVYIIDEVHMLSTSAFNALLKTLEEPPEHVKFIFATTEIRKVPVTVLSRCQRFDLRRIEPEDMIGLLKRIAEAEKITISEEALALIVRAGEGSARDATSLLDQAIAHGAGEISADQVRAMLGLADRGRVLDLFDHIVKGDTKAALSELAAQYAAGADPVAILRDLAEVTHWVSLVAITPEAADDPTVGPDERARGLDFAQKLPMRVLTRNWQMLLKCLDEMATAPNAMMAAEMAIIRLTHVANLPSPGDLVRRLSAAPAQPSGGPGSSGMVPNGSGDVPRARMAQNGAAPVASPAPQPLARLARFEDVVALVRARRDVELLREIERGVKLVRYEPGLIEFEPSDQARPDLAATLGRKLGQWTGTRWGISVVGSGGAQTLAEQAAAAQSDLDALARAHPMVQAVFETFPGAKLRPVKAPQPAMDAEVAAPVEDDDWDPFDPFAEEE